MRQPLALLLLLGGAGAQDSSAAEGPLLDPRRTWLGQMRMFDSRPQVVVETTSTSFISPTDELDGGGLQAELLFTALITNANLLPALGAYSTGPFLNMELLQGSTKIWHHCTDTHRSPDREKSSHMIIITGAVGMNVTANAYIADRCFASKETGYDRAYARDSVKYRLMSRDLEVLDVAVDGSAEEEPLVQHFRQSLHRALRNESKLSHSAMGEEVLHRTEGMSGYGIRHLLNNIVGYSGGVRYLEVGLWKGSTFCSSLALNSLEFAIGVDNWAEFGGPREAFFTTLAKCKGDSPVYIIERDMLEAAAELRNPASPPPPLHTKGINVYLFDGPHGFKDQYAAIMHFYHLLSEVAIILVDDYNMPNEQAGTEAALEDLVRLGELQVLYKGGVLTNRMNHKGWHNGFVGFVVRRTGGAFVERGRMRDEL